MSFQAIAAEIYGELEERLRAVISPEDLENLQAVTGVLGGIVIEALVKLGDQAGHLRVRDIMFAADQVLPPDLLARAIVAHRAMLASVGEEQLRAPALELRARLEAAERATPV